MKHLQNLNPEQLAAVTYTDGPLLILAGAGSGKTRVITHRIAHLILVHKVEPAEILAVTFTNKATGEMRSRVRSLLDGVPICSAPNVWTFHSFAVRLLRADGESLASIRPGFTRKFSIYDSDGQLTVLRGVLKRLGIDGKQIQPTMALATVSHAKNTKQKSADLYNSVNPEVAAIASIFDEYEGTLRRQNALDFDDLLLEAVRLLQHDEAVREKYNRLLSYVMVDEYQDTNRSQYELMRLLTERRGNVCVVGDEDQTIYSWRGANIQNVLDFEKDFPGAKVIKLEQNYRSTKNILEAASALVSNNSERMGKWLRTDSPAGKLIGLHPAFDSEGEAEFIAESIEGYLVESAEFEIAVLYRTNMQSRQIEEALRRRRIQYAIVGGTSFYQRPEIKDAIAYLRLALSPEDSVSLRRIIDKPARDIGKETIKAVLEYSATRGVNLWQAVCELAGKGQPSVDRAEAARDGQSPLWKDQPVAGQVKGKRKSSREPFPVLAEFRDLMEGLSQAIAGASLRESFELILERTGYREALESDGSIEAGEKLLRLRELVNAADESGKRGETVQEFLDFTALVSETDSLDESRVKLLTLHSVKGLEFPIVFIAGMEEGLLPHSRAFESEAMMEEERRLCYVGMTRAQKHLILTRAEFRNQFGVEGSTYRELSRFLGEIPAELTEQLGFDELEEMKRLLWTR